MTHKGGKRAKKAFGKIHISKAMKEKIEDLPHSQLMILLTFIRALLASSAHAGKASHGGKARKPRHLSPGTHRVSIRGKMRKVRVLSNGRWRFLKG